jgi:hypothetical protein
MFVLISILESESFLFFDNLLFLDLSYFLKVFISAISYRVFSPIFFVSLGSYQNSLFAYVSG